MKTILFYAALAAAVGTAMAALSFTAVRAQSGTFVASTTCIDVDANDRCLEYSESTALDPPAPAADPPAPVLGVSPDRRILATPDGTPYICDDGFGAGTVFCNGKRK